MTIVAGCDIGSLTSKAVILNGNRILGYAMHRSRANPETSAETVLNLAMEKAKVRKEDIRYCVGTGYGRNRIAFADEAVSEIACHAKGARWLIPTARTVIDIGGQDCKAMCMDKNGKVMKFVANDKCASGTGRFLEVMARLLDLPLENMGRLTDEAREPVTLASTCTVWAQADVIKYLNSGYSVADIGAGVNIAMANRAAMLANSVGIEDDVCMTGGVAKNQGVLSNLEKIIGHPIKRARKADPQIAGAIGAALFALEKTNGRS